VSTETAPDPTMGEQNADVANPPGMGGSSTAEEVRADDAGTTEEGQEQNPDGAEPEGAERTGEEPAPREEARPDRDENYVSELEQRVSDADAIARTIMADPARLREYQKWAKADSGGGSDDDPLAGIDRSIEESFPRPEDREAVRKFVGPLAQTVRDLREQMRNLAPRVEQSARIATSTELARSLEANGVTAETQRTPEWRKFLARERRDTDLQRDMSRRPGYAGKNLARAWQAQTGTRAQRTAENRRTSDLRDGRFHAAPSTSRNGAEKVTVIDKSKPGWDLELLNARIVASQRGEKFRHTFATPKK